MTVDPGDHLHGASHDEEARRRLRRRREGMLLVAAVVAALLFVVFEMRLPPFTSSQTVTSHILFFLLINANILLILVVTFLIGRNVVRLIFERRQRVVGSQLRTRLVVGFVAVSLVPAVALFLVALGFLRSSMESWFSVQVENALEGSLDVVDLYYREAADRAAQRAREVARRAAELKGMPSQAVWKALASSARAELDASSVEILGREGQVLGAAAAERLPDDLRRPLPPDLLGDALAGTPGTRTEEVGSADVVLAAAPVKATDGSVRAVVAVTEALPRAIARSRTEIARSYDQYRQVRVLRRPLVNNYVLTLLLATLVVAFGGIWAGFAIAKTITVPIQRLAEATRAVAAGRLDQRIVLDNASEEVGALAEAFNQMTEALATTHAALFERRRTLEAVLANIAAGVVLIDRQGRLEIVNLAARVILDVGEAAVGLPFRDCMAGPEVAPVTELLADLEARARDGVWDKLTPQRVSLSRGDRSMLLLATGVVLRGEAGRAIGALLFLEDVTELLTVQRMEAWREVARRIAHEIKNPLTPIQLSAQRLRKRYASELGGSVLDECTRTIINEVEVLKNLVSEFSHFARLPAGQHRPTDLNELVEESLVLFREAHRGVRFGFARSPDLPILDLDRDGFRRVLTNILDNAVAALPQASATPAEGGLEPSRARGAIDVETRWERERDLVVLEISDDGCGMSPEVKARLFEPYFSTKPQGTGLGLAIAQAVLADHQAFIRVRDNVPRGSRFVIELPVRERRPSLAAGRQAIG